MEIGQPDLITSHVLCPSTAVYVADAVYRFDNCCHTDRIIFTCHLPAQRSAELESKHAPRQGWATSASHLCASLHGCAQPFSLPAW